MRTTIWLAGLTGLVVAGAFDARLHGERSRPPVASAAEFPTDASEPTRARLAGPLAHLREEVEAAPDGTLAIANLAYRARFSARDGAVHTPRVNGRLEPRLAWRFRARTLATSTTTRALEPIAPVVSATGPHVVDFVRDGLIERYEGERGGLEQIFVVTERPAGRGDVRITGDVTFAGTIRAAGGGLTFDAGHGLPPFTYAAPVAVDAAQRPVPVRVETAGASLSLVLEGAALDRAAWPITIDPLLGVTTVDANTQDLEGVDIAYSWRRNEFLVVYIDVDPGDEDYRDIKLRRYRDFGDAVAAPTVVVAGTGTRVPSKPDMDCNLHIARCLLVWETGTSSTLTAVRAQLLTDTGVAIGAPFDPGEGYVDGYDATYERSPRVVARNFREQTVDDVAFFVTWRENIVNQQFYLQYVRVTGTGNAINEGHWPAPNAPTAAPLAYDPLSDRAVTIWSDGPWSVRARFINAWTGHGPPLAVASDTGDPVVFDLGIAYDRAARRFLATWSTFDSPIVLHGRMLSIAYTLSTVGPAFEIASGDGILLGGPIAAQNGTFVVRYLTLETGYATRLARIGADGTVLSDVEVSASLAGAFIAALETSQTSYLAFAGETTLGKPAFGNRGRWGPAFVHGDGGDFDGDGKAELYVYRPATGQFVARKSSVPPGSPLPPDTTVALGGPTCLPAVMDWDGDGLADLAVWDILTGRWTIRVSSTAATEVIALGRAGDIPVPGDYLGDGADEIGVFRPSTGQWQLKTRGSTTTTTVAWGQAGDQPVPADYDNDGKAELGVFRPSSGQWITAEIDLSGQSVRSHGLAGDTAFAGNFVGAGEADLVVFRRGAWHIQDGGTAALSAVTTGGRIPLALDWDRNGYLDLAVFNEENGDWSIRYGAQYYATFFGMTGDIPVGR